MTGQELQSALSELGWQGSDLGRRLSIHANTVSRWKTGERPVPSYVAEYLRVCGLAREMLDLP